ncbi:MAG: helicase-related protein [Nanoarchaeota archaeon]|nr:helicase-related protein [Nanoarchaeota archaeon]
MKIEEISNRADINLALDTLKLKKQALIFANTKRSAEKAAEDIAAKVTITQPLEDLEQAALKALASPTKQCKRLGRCLKKGIAFHHAGLTLKQRTLIEDNFKAGKIKIICCTPTLAMGIDMPAFRTIIKDLRRFGFRGLTYIPVLEYLQMAGRAGRPGYDTEGQAIIIAASELEKEKLTEKYLLGDPEEIQSKLAVEPVLRTYLLSLIAAGFVSSKQQIFDFFAKTFWAHQFEDMHVLQTKIESMLELLEEWEFLKSNVQHDDFESANILKEEKYEATVVGKRVAELYLDPYTARQLVLGMKRATKMKVPTISFLHLISSTLEIRPQLRVTAKDQDDVNEAVTKVEHALLEKEPSLYDEQYDDFLNAMKTALFFHDWIEENTEENLLEKYNIRPGEVRTKIDIADWLCYCCIELTKLMSLPKLSSHMQKLRIRITNGVKEELIPLLKLKGIGRARGRKLHKNDIRTLGDIKKIEIMDLVQILGKAIALSVKKQVGQDFDKLKIKENKRKGQISLKDF